MIVVATHVITRSAWSMLRNVRPLFCGINSFIFCHGEGEWRDGLHDCHAAVDTAGCKKKLGRSVNSISTRCSIFSCSICSRTLASEHKSRIEPLHQLLGFFLRLLSGFHPAQ